MGEGNSYVRVGGIALLVLSVACGDDEPRTMPIPPEPIPRLSLASRVSVTPSFDRHRNADEIIAENFRRVSEAAGDVNWEVAFQPPRGALSLRNAPNRVENNTRAVRLRNTEGVALNPGDVNVVAVPGSPPFVVPPDPEVLEAASRSVNLSFDFEAAEDVPEGYSLPALSPFGIRENGCEGELLNRVQASSGGVVRESEFCDLMIEFTAHEVGLYLQDLLIRVESEGEDATLRLLLMGRVSPSHVIQTPRGGE